MKLLARSPLLTAFVGVVGIAFAGPFIGLATGLLPVSPVESIESISLLLGPSILIYAIKEIASEFGSAGSFGGKLLLVFVVEFAAAVAILHQFVRRNFFIVGIALTAGIWAGFGWFNFGLLGG
jgi:hypothetical protein